jgi:hypothetical protein
MARARNIKPGFFKNEDLGTADPFVSLLFAGLWTLADKAGVLEDRPLRIKAELFPYREGFDINGYITVLMSLGFIHKYEANGIKLIQIANFTKHQNPHHTEKASEYPEYSESCQQSVKSPLITGDAPADSLIPDSLIPDSLIPDSGFRIPETTLPTASPPANEENPPKKDTALQAACRVAWDAYKTAFTDRYGAAPIRDAKANAAIKAFVQSVGYEVAPAVARFYLTHGDAFYVRQCHPPGMLQKDAAKLHTEWVTGNQMTATRAMQSDRTSANLASHNGALALLEARGLA